MADEKTPDLTEGHCPRATPCRFCRERAERRARQQSAALSAAAPEFWSTPLYQGAALDVLGYWPPGQIPRELMPSRRGAAHAPERARENRTFYLKEPKRPGDPRRKHVHFGRV